MSQYTFHHMHLRSRDPEATAAFYERMFGAEITRASHEGKTRIEMKVGGVNIFIAQVAPDSGVNPAPTTPYEGLDHFGLRVSGVDEITAELKAKGAQFTMEPTTIRPGVRIAFLRGPEGVSIELVDPTAS